MLSTRCMKFAIWKKSPVKPRVYGMIGNPAGPTDAPIGSIETAASVGSAVVVVVVESVEVDVVLDVEVVLELELSDVGGVDVVEVVVGGAEPPPELFRSNVWNWTPERSARCCSTTASTSG